MTVRIPVNTLRMCLAACLITSSLAAQSGTRPAPPTARITVSGVAFDSLRGAPLADAFVMIPELSRSTTSDAKGRFVFDTLAPGTYTFAMQHAVFDSLGLSGTQTRVTLTDSKATVTLSVPSFATFWTTACGALPVPAKDSGLVYGSIRDAKAQSPVAGAWIELSWMDLVNLGTKTASNVTQRRWKSEAQSDARGGYTVCGVPTESQLRIRATYLANTTGAIDMPPSTDRVRRRDLMVAGTLAGDSALRGTIIGHVANPSGQPIPGVRVILDDSTEVRTDLDGRFALRAVRTGTRQLDLASIGMTPFSTTVDVMRNDTALVTASLRTVTNLEALNITASTSRRRAAVLFDERRKMGFGSYLDSTAIGQRGTMSAAFSGFAGVTVQNVRANGRLFNLYLPSTGTGPCLAMLLVDGIQQFDHEILSMMYPEDIAAIEVYQHRMTIPVELMRSDPKCGVIAVWTKRSFR